jgi:hypothetical protein
VIVYIHREGGKVKVWTKYADDAPFVEMALKGSLLRPSEKLNSQKTKTVVK